MLRRLYLRGSTRLRYAWSSGALKRWLRYGGLAIAVVWVTWIVVTGLLVRRDAADIQDRLARVQAQIAQGDLAGARSTAASIPALAHRAHELTTGPAWWTAAAVPYVGRPFEIARTATSVADDVGSNGVPALLQVATDLDPTVLRTGPSSVDLAPISAAAPKLTAAARVLDDAVTRLDAAPRSSWLGQVDTVRSELAQDLRAVADYVDAGARTTRVLPEMLGNDGARRYFVGLQNEAELRGTGGLPGAFAIAVADHGTVRFTHFESDDALLPVANNYLVPTGLDFGTDYNQIYGASGPTQLFQNSNLSPSFSYAARIWAAMWEKRTGEHVDGAVALDPQVLANFLSATGPVPTPSGVTLSAASVVSLTQQQQYTLFPDLAQRKTFLVDVLHAVADRILDGSAAPRLLVQAMSLSAQQHRVVVWTDQAAVQRQIDQTNYAGMQVVGDRPLIGLVLNNLVGGKLDYYLGRSLSYTRIGCGSSRDMVVTISLTNAAPASGLPAIVTGRLDGATRTSGGEGPSPGDNRTLLDYFATSGAQLTSVTIDGTPSTAAVLEDRGHPVFRFDLELPRGTTREIVLHLSEPAGQGTPIVWRQPGVVPLRVEGWTNRARKATAVLDLRSGVLVWTHWWRRPAVIRFDPFWRIARDRNAQCHQIGHNGASWNDEFGGKRWEEHVTDGPDVPGEWDPSGQVEPPAALLRRAISHVEQLLQRLERPGVPGEGESDSAPGSSGPVGGSPGVPGEYTVLSGSNSGSGGVEEGAAIEPVVANPVRRISSAAQAEALRVSLNAHEKANRLLAEASAIRAQSASEGEQILVEARELADRMQNEAGEEAALYVVRAREEAENLVAQAAGEMQRVRDAAVEDSDRIRAEAQAEAQRLLQSAESDSTRMRSEAEAEARIARQTAHEESERQRAEAAAESDQLRTGALEESDRLRGEAAASALITRESAKTDTDRIRLETEQLRDSVQQEANRLLTASSEEAQRLRSAAELEADRVRSDAESQARVDREAADQVIREVLDKATVDAERIRTQAREQGVADAAQLVEAQVRGAIAEARADLDADRVRVYELLGTANTSIAEVRGSMRDLVESLGRSMGSVNGATGSIDALMGRLRDAARDGGVDIPGAPEDLSPPSVPSDDTGPIPTVISEPTAAEAGAVDGDGARDPAFDIDAMFDEGAAGQRNADEDAVEVESNDSADTRRPLGLLFGASHKKR